MSKIFVDQVDPKTGTSLTLGTSGDTVNIPSGVTLANAGTVTGLPASAISSGTIDTARLGSGTASSSTILYGDQTYKTAPSAGLNLLSMIDQDLGTASKIQFQQVFASSYDYYRVIGCFFLGSNSAHDIEFRFLDSSNSEQTASEYYGVAQGWRYSTSANDRSDWGQWTASGLDIMRDVLGGAAWKKVSLDMLIFPDAYASTTYNSMIWNAGYMKYQGGTTAISNVEGNGI